MFVVVDSAFNRAHYPLLVGNTYNTPPSYAQVREISPKSQVPTLDKNTGKNREWRHDESA
jgi:hypothetical protein